MSEVVVRGMIMEGILASTESIIIISMACSLVVIKQRGHIWIS